MENFGSSGEIGKSVEITIVTRSMSQKKEKRQLKCRDRCRRRREDWEIKI